MWVGVDDTDSPQGGCTTWVLTELVRLAREHRLDLLGEPALVRLNPNIPWKTRGNAALRLRLGHGRGVARTIGELDGTPVPTFEHGGPLTRTESDRYFDAAWRRVAEVPKAPGTDPALVSCSRRPPESFYRAAVREYVAIGHAVAALRGVGARWRTRSGRRGLIGATAAIAWRGRTPTWELIAYRRPERQGRPREVDRASVLRAQRRHPELFLCHDPRTRRLLVAPHTPCPILFGLRGRTPEAPVAALPLIRSEPVDRWLLFGSNQGTGDHLVERKVGDFARYRSGWLDGTVDGATKILAGGHARFDVRSEEGRIACLAFEPTKTLPAVARDLRPGDRVRVWGSAGSRRTLRLEGIELVRLAPAGRWAPPTCARCGLAVRSLGTGRGWRCPRCRKVFPLEAGGWAVPRRAAAPGVYHPTPSARRHLAPLPTADLASPRELLRGS